MGRNLKRSDERPSVRDVLDVYRKRYPASANMPVWKEPDLEAFVANKLRDLTQKEAYADTLERFEDRSPTFRTLRSFGERLTECEERLTLARTRMEGETSFGFCKGSTR